MHTKRTTTRLIVGLATLCLTSGSSVLTLDAHVATRVASGSTQPWRTTDAAARKRIRALRSMMPLRFEPADVVDQGRADFVARGEAYGVALAAGRADVTLRSTSEHAPVTIGVKFAGASNRAAASGRRLLPGVTNYLIGNDPRAWRAGVRGYAQVEYRDLYPGVDIVYYGNQQRLEYDLVVAPGASYRAIAIELDGARAVRIDREGHLVITTATGDLVQRAPVIYQDKHGAREPVSGGYVRRGRGRFGFWVGQHDPNLPLVIDPVLTYATYLGGSGEERADGVAIDADGNIYVTGMTGAANFPVTATAATHGRDNFDVFVVKLNAAGDQLQYATYLGGFLYEEPSDIAVDAAGNAYIIGTTQSMDFPTLHAIQSSRRGDSDSFVAKLDPSGNVVYSTLLGGDVTETGDAIAVDRFGRAYVSGSTFSPDFPTVDAMQLSPGGNALYRTVDGGLTWSGSSSGLRAGAVVTFAIDPSTTSIVYAGTWSDGVFGSSDGGATWTATSGTLPRAVVNAMTVAPDGTVYVANDFGIYSSSDRGASWIGLLIGVRVSALIVDPASGSIYAGLQQGVITSADNGRTWNTTGLQTSVYSLAIAQSVLYAGTSNGLFKNVRGSGWQSTAAGDGHAVIQTVTSISVNPNDANQLYAGTTNGLFYTSTGGSAWTSFPVWSGARVFTVAMVPSAPSIVYVATTWGSGTTDDGGTTWRAAGVGGGGFCFAVDPRAATTVYQGTVLTRDAFVARISADGSALEYSTYVGGTGSEWASDIAIDSTGAAYVAGTTQSPDFPTRNPLQPKPGGLMDVFVVKLSDAGSLAYGTYLGGSASDYGPRIAVDGSAQAHVVGVTLSPNFPLANAYQPAHGGGFSDVFVTTLNAAGNGLVYSTYLGGSDQEVDASQSLGPDVAIGPEGDAIVTGTTRSRNFPTRNAIQTVHAGGTTDAFVARFGSDGRLRYSTYLGGSADDSGLRVAVDPNGPVVVVGATTSIDFPTRNAFQSTNAGAADVFLARLDPGEPLPDTTAPTTHIATAGMAGTNGWYRGAVEIALTAVDDVDGSGVRFIEYSIGDGAFQRYETPFSIATQGTTAIRARATDMAGNVENPAATIAVAIDTASPAVTITSPTASDYPHSDVLQLSFAASDSLSGVASGSPTATLDGLSVANAQTIQLLALPLGSHTLAVSAVDQAGNAIVQTVTFQIKATVDSLIAAVDAFASQGQIDARRVRSLQSKLSDARQALGRGNLSAVRGDLEDFAASVSAQSGNGIAVDAARVLLADDRYVLSSM